MKTPAKSRRSHAAVKPYIVPFLALALGVSFLSSVLAGSGPEPFTWRTAAPESVGMSESKLEQMRAGLERRKTRALLVMRDGRVVLEWYAAGTSAAKAEGTASAAKALIGGTAVALALTDDTLKLNDAAAKFVPEWAADARKRKITIRQLGSHTSGLDDAEENDLPHNKLTGWKGDFWKRLPVPNDPFTLSRDSAPVVSEPGTKEAYSNPGIAMLTYSVARSYKASATSSDANVRELLRTRVLRPIGIADDEWAAGYGQTFDVGGAPMVAAWGGGNFTPRAAARIGRLMLRDGDWDGKRILSRAAVNAVTNDAGTPGTGGIGWWTNSDGSRNPLPADAYCALGAGHQVVIVIPSLKIVVVRNGASLGDGDWDAELKEALFVPLMDAVTKR